MRRPFRAARIEIDRCMRPPDMMPGPRPSGGKVLGPRNLKPNHQGRHRDHGRERGRRGVQGAAEVQFKVEKARLWSMGPG